MDIEVHGDTCVTTFDMVDDGKGGKKKHSARARVLGEGNVAMSVDIQRSKIAGSGQVDGNSADLSGSVRKGRIGVATTPDGYVLTKLLIHMNDLTGDGIDFAGGRIDLVEQVPIDNG